MTSANTFLAWVACIGAVLCVVGLLSLRYGEQALHWLQRRRALLKEHIRRSRDR